MARHAGDARVKGGPERQNDYRIAVFVPPCQAICRVVWSLRAETHSGRVFSRTSKAATRRTVGHIVIFCRCRSSGPVSPLSSSSTRRPIAFECRVVALVGDPRFHLGHDRVAETGDEVVGSLAGGVGDFDQIDVVPERLVKSPRFPLVLIFLHCTDFTATRALERGRSDRQMIEVTP